MQHRHSTSSFGFGEKSGADGSTFPQVEDFADARENFMNSPLRRRTVEATGE
jgi:hypothetical protein